ncbi:MAG: hypothetical protein LBO04_06420, partial [Spirochaetaceae bacterium]|nr:hypothetical protein [Spirochaetaceae bacterium]
MFGQGFLLPSNSRYHTFFVTQDVLKQDMSIYPAGKKYAVAAFADIGIYQIMKYNPQTKTASAIPGKSLWFNVESQPVWNMYEYSSEEELSIPQKLTLFEKVNWEPVTLVLSVLRDFGYKTVSFDWKTYWAENEGSLDCTAHIVLDCAADKNGSRGADWIYYDMEKNPGAGWKWATWNFSSPIGTVADRPYIRCAYGYYKHEKTDGFL